MNHLPLSAMIHHPGYAGILYPLCRASALTGGIFRETGFFSL